jgi:hypothetical protein
MATRGAIYRFIVSIHLVSRGFHPCIIAQGLAAISGRDNKALRCYRRRPFSKTAGPYLAGTSSALTFWYPRGTLPPRAARLPANSFQSEALRLR